jgi:mono/diheme cytochrome c family protein
MRHAAAAVASTMLLGLLPAGAAHAADPARGRQLFENTRGVTGKPVGNCISCHANQAALREMIANRGGKPGDARSVRGVLQAALDGAVVGAFNAKAQFRGVLTAKDLDDLAAYLATAKRASATPPHGSIQAQLAWHPQAG